MEKEWVWKGFVTIFLMLNTGWDIRKRKVLLGSIVSFGILGMIHLFFVEKEMVFLVLCGVLPGMFLILCSYVTRQSVGYGDGLIVLVCGLYLGLWQTFAMVFYGLLFCSAVSVFLLLLRKRTYKTGVPFVPYLLAGYVCTQIFK